MIRKDVVEIVDRLKREVPPEVLAELAGDTEPHGAAAFVDLHEKIDEMDLNQGSEDLPAGAAAQLRELLHRLVEVTRPVGGKLVRIGQRIVRWILAFVERYPGTTAAILVMAALAYFVAAIPVLGMILFPIVQLVAAGVVGFIFVSELSHGLMGADAGSR